MGCGILTYSKYWSGKAWRFCLTLIALLPFASATTSAQLKENIDSLQLAFRKAPTDLERCQLLIRLAETYRYINSDSAMRYVDQANSLVQNINAAGLKLDIAILNAIVSYEKGHYAQSIRQLRRIEADALQFGDQVRLMKVYQTYGNSYGLANDYRQAIAYELKALDYAKALKDSLAMAHLYINIGSDFHYIKAYKEAIQYCSKARRFYAQLGQDFYQGFALNNLSNYSKHLKDYQKALSYADEASKYWNETNNERLMPYLYHNYGDIYKGLKQYSKAEKYYQKAVLIRERNKDSKDLVITNNELADLYLLWGHPDKALALATSTYELANSKFFELEAQQSAALLAAIYEQRGEPGRALTFFKISQTRKDSLQAREQARDVLRLQTKYETAEKENLILQQRNKIAASQLSLKSRNFWIFGLSSLTIMIGLIGYLLYKQQVLKNTKQQGEIKLQLAIEKIENQNRLQEQRLTISRDLHDNIGAQLTFIISAMDTLRHYAQDNDQHLINKFEHISAFTKDTMQELRDTVWAMNKPNISLKDLEARIANFIEKARQSQQLTDISFCVDKSVPLNTRFTGTQGLNCYRIIQEATHNALKYAEASAIKIHIYAENHVLQFSIQDNGKGFDRQCVESGNGLQNMYKRAAELAAGLLVSTKPGHGTRVAFSIGETAQANVS